MNASLYIPRSDLAKGCVEAAVSGSVFLLRCCKRLIKKLLFLNNLLVLLNIVACLGAAISRLSPPISFLQAPEGTAALATSDRKVVLLELSWLHLGLEPAKRQSTAGPGELRVLLVAILRRDSLAV